MLLISSCTGTGSPSPSDAVHDEPTTVPSSTVSPTSTTVPPTTSTTAAVPRIEPPELADPFDLAEEALAAVPGYEPSPSEVPPPPLGRLDMVLNVTTIAEAMVWDLLENDAGDEVFVASVYPYGSARGDPTLPPFVVSLLAEFDESPEQIPIEHGFVYASEGFETPWMAWGSNTVVIVAAGDREATLEVVAALAAANQDEYRWQAGDCLWLGSDESGDGAPFAPYGRGPVVPCDGWHTHEVIAGASLPDGPDDPFPAETMPIAVWETCEERFLEYVGIPERDSNVSLTRYHPSDLEWEEGDRYLACVVTQYDASGAPAPREASLAGIGEASRLVRHPGDCGLGSYAGEAVPCEAPHDLEYLGTVDLPAADGAAYPADSLYADADSRCRALLDEYVGAVPDGAEVDAVGLPPGPFAWSQGDRRVMCIGFVTDTAGFPQLVIGSMAEEGWRVVGPVGDNVTV